MKILYRILIATFVFLLSLPAQTATVKYTVSDLGTAYGTSNSYYAMDINNKGQVAGLSQNAGSPLQPFIYSDGIMHPISTPASTSAEAYGINAKGQVVGFFYYLTPVYQPHAFIYDNGTLSDLGTLGGSGCVAQDINDNGQIVGSLWGEVGPTRGFIYHDGIKQVLGTLGGANDSSNGIAINASGQVAGNSDLAGQNGEHAVLFSGGQIIDLKTLGGTNSNVRDINDSGQVVGWADTSQFGIYHAFVYSGNKMTDLGSLGDSSSANGINKSGQIVGDSYIGGDSCATLFSGGSAIDLNKLIEPSSGWVLKRANSINDSGQIVGWGIIDGNYHAFLLSPVPEPSIITLLGMSGIGLIA